MLEGIPDVPVGLKGVAAVRNDEAFFAAVAVIEVSEPCGDGT